jgi:hypothetical protein
VPTYYIRKALETLREEGPVVLTKKFLTLIEYSVLHPLTQWWKYGRHYDADLNTFRHIWVPPDEIYLAKKRPVGKGGVNIGHVIGGDWDQNKLRFENNPFSNQRELETNILYQSIHEHFINGVDWKDTALFTEVIHGDTYWRGIDTQSKFYSRTEILETLFDDMKKNGYRTYQQRDGNSIRKTTEINVMIGRDGCFFFVDGKHRLIISKILDLDEVAVNVVVRHKQWQELREEIYNNGLPEEREELRDHPDLQDILD